MLGFPGSLVIGDKPVTSSGFVKSSHSPTQRFANRRRKRSTKAEEELVRILNSEDHGLYRGKFQREWAFAGKWILDFFFVENRFGIEVDGKYHETEAQQLRDMKKSKACEQFGVTLIRLTNDEVFGDRQKLLSKIRDGYRIANQRHKKQKESTQKTISKRSEVKMQPPTVELTDYERELIDKHLSFYRALATGKRKPTTGAQKHFVAMCEGRAKAETVHEFAYVKYMRIQRAYEEKEYSRGIPEYEEGLPRQGWCTDNDWKKMRTGNYADMKKRQRDG